MKSIWLAFVIFALAAGLVLVAGCGGGGGSSFNDDDGNGGDDGGVNPPVDPPSGSVILRGKIARRDTGIGVANVRVEFGTPPVIAFSDSQGEFRLNLGTVSSPTLLHLFPTFPHEFLVDTSGAGANYPAGAWVLYYGAQYAPNKISLDGSADATKVLFRQSTDLGVVYVTYDDPGGGPPDPPGFP